MQWWNPQTKTKPLQLRNTFLFQILHVHQFFITEINSLFILSIYKIRITKRICHWFFNWEVFTIYYIITVHIYIYIYNKKWYKFWLLPTETWMKGKQILLLILPHNSLPPCSFHRPVPSFSLRVPARPGLEEPRTLFLFSPPEQLRHAMLKRCGRVRLMEASLNDNPAQTLEADIRLVCQIC